MESVHNYFAKVKQTDGSEIEPNKDLDLLKADHYVLGYEKRIGENLRLKVEAYYHYIRTFLQQRVLLFSQCISI